MTITLYQRWTCPVSGAVKIVRCALDAQWNERTNEIAERTGVILREGAFIKISARQFGFNYVTPEQWNELPCGELYGKWTADPHSPPIVIANGAACDNALVDSWFGNAALAQSAENKFIRDTYAKRVVQIDSNMHDDSDNMYVSLRA